MDDVRFCPGCGKERSGDDAFCSRCGRRLVGAAGAPGEAVEHPASRPYAIPKPKTANGDRDFRIAAAFLFIILLAGLYFWRLAGSHSVDATRGSLTDAPIVAPTVPPGPPCDQARQLVSNRHSTLFGLMGETVGEVGFECTDRSPLGVVTVRVNWDWNGSTHEAQYDVTPDDEVSPDDANAQRIDEVAKYGPFALKAVLSL